MNFKTIQFRIKDSTSRKHLEKMAGSVNFVWNCCQEISMESIKKHNRFLSGFDLNKYTSGCSKNLGISSVSIQAICEEYATRRYQFKKTKLKWRAKKNALGWIPFKGNVIKVDDNEIQYGKHIFKFWKSRPINSKVHCGSFNQCPKGNWFVRLVVEDTKQELDRKSVV